MNGLVHVAEDDEEAVIVLVDWDGFDVEERTWESLRKIHASAPEFVLRELRKLRVTRALKVKLASCVGVQHCFVKSRFFRLGFVWLSSSFFLRSNKLWGCCSQKRYQDVGFPGDCVLKWSSSRGRMIYVPVLFRSCSLMMLLRDHSVIIHAL